MNQPEFTFDREALIESFNETAETAQSENTLPHEIANRLMERLSFVKIEPQTILELGSNDGYLTQQLASKHPNANILSLDIAKNRLKQIKTQKNTCFLCADAEALPIKKQSMDLVISNLTLHWSTENLAKIFKQIRHILKPGGVFLFSMFGIETLPNLIPPFFKDMHHVGDDLLQNGFQDPVMDMENLTLEYPNPTALYESLKNAGGFYFLDKPKESNSPKADFEIIYGYAAGKFSMI